MELHTCQLLPLLTVKALTPAALMNFVPVKTMLPVVVAMPCPLISVRPAVLAMVTLPVALIAPTDNAALFFTLSAPTVALVDTELMVLLALLRVMSPGPPMVMP